MSIVGDISERIGSSLQWKIPSWKSCMNRTYDIAQSPSFQFRGATWMLEIMYVDHLQHLNLYVIRKTWEQDSQVVLFKLIIRMRNGREYKIAEDQFEFTKDNNQYECFIIEEFAHKSARDGSLTITCVFYKYRTIAAAKMQSKSSKNFEKLSADFKELFLSEKGSDVTLKVQNREFKAHKAILRARSKVFDSMFTHDMKENSSGIVCISDCAPETFQDLLLYMYCGDVDKISTNSVFGLYQASDKYDVDKLKEKCVQFIMDILSVETFLDVIALAVQHNESALIEKAKIFFVSNEKEIILRPQWLCFVKDHPVEANVLHIIAVDEMNSL